MASSMRKVNFISPGSAEEVRRSVEGIETVVALVEIVPPLGDFQRSWNNEV
jgi:hypothetical protein